MRAPSPGPIRVALWLLAPLVLIGALVMVRQGGDRRAETRSTKTLAVLPFSLEGLGSDQSHLAAGLNVDLMDRLAMIDSLQCISRQEVLAHLARSHEANQLARRLGAEVLVTGSLSEHSGVLSISLRVDDARLGRTLAKHQISEPLDKILELQKEVAAQVISSLQIPGSSDREDATHKSPTRSLKAWMNFSQGVLNLDNLINPRSPVFAAELLEQALRLDPTFSQARARLSLALWRAYRQDREPSALEAARLHASRAVEEAPDMDAAAVALAITSQSRVVPGTSPRDLPEEIAALAKPDQALRALAAIWLQVGELGFAESAWLEAAGAVPDNWLNPYGYGQFLLQGGRLSEAEHQFERAATLAPVDNTWPEEAILSIRMTLGDLAGAVEVFEGLLDFSPDTELSRQLAAAYSILNRLEPAEALFRQALQLDPSDPRIRLELGDVIARSGRAEEAAVEYSLALAVVEQEVDSQPTDRRWQRYFALLAAKAGRCAEALPLASTLLRHQPESAAASHDLARVFAVCGDGPLTLSALSAAIRQGQSPELIRSQSEFDWLASNEEFLQILQSAEATPPSP